MPDLDKRWIGLGGGLLLVVVIGAAFLFGGDAGSNDDMSDASIGDTTPASGSATGATGTPPATHTPEEVIVGGIASAMADEEFVLGIFDPINAPPSIRSDAAFHPLEACRPGVGPFTSDLQFTFSPITDSLWAVDTLQRGTQATSGALDVPSGTFVTVGGGTNYGEVYIGQMIFTGPPDTPDGLVIVGINVSGSAGSWITTFDPFSLDQRDADAAAAFEDQSTEIAFLTEAGRAWFHSFGDEPSLADLPANADLAAQLAAALDDAPLPPPLDTVAADSSGCGLAFGVQVESWW